MSVVCVELASRLQCGRTSGPDEWPDEWTGPSGRTSGEHVLSELPMGHFDHFWVISTRFGLILFRF